MAKSASSKSRTPVFPEAVERFLRRRAAEATGLLLAALAVALALALISYSPTDPSLNGTGTGGIGNWIGRPGAYVADFLLQGFGLAAALPVPMLVAWGWRTASKRGVNVVWLRTVLGILAILLCAIALDAVPAPASWPLRSGLGGVSGAVMAAYTTGPLAGLTGAPAWSLAGAVGLFGLAALFFALALDDGEWLSMGRGLARTGGALRRRLATMRETRKLRREGRREPTVVTRPKRRDREEAERPAVSRTGKTRPAAAAGQGRVETPAPSPVGKSRQASGQGRLDLSVPGQFEAPPLDLLDGPKGRGGGDRVNAGALEQNARLLESVLDDFGVRGEIVKVRPGPVVTLYELEPAPGTKTSRVINLSDDIARSMSAISVRVAVIPGRNVIGIELPNADREMVHLRELLASPAFQRAGGKLKLALGKDIGGSPVTVDLTRMPHLLIAGTTGSGKSVAINTMLLTLLYQLPPDQCKLILIDPKMLELSVYEGIPHLLSPVVTEPGKAVVALKWTVREMEERYRVMSQLGVRNIAGYNQRIAEAKRKKEVLTRRVQTGFDGETGQPVFEDQPLSMDPLPFIVVVVDEMADLMLVAGKDIEAAVQRLAQMARAAGIHLIMATQRPSVDVITGTIKANFPTRVSFQVTSKIDSRTILGEQGAEQLLGQGDMLYMAGGGRISRVHGPFVGDDEVERVVSYLKTQGEPDYVEDVTEDDDGMLPGFGGNGGNSSGDALFDEAVALVAREGKVSTSFIQRHLQIGYNRAARIVEQMEAEGMITKANRVGRREVLLGRGDADV